jgi:oxaloacetate decarboxylase beta subunit
MTGGELAELLRVIVVTQTGVLHVTWGNVLMWGVGLFLLYLATAKNVEPLLLVPIGFGVFIVNFPLTPLMGISESGASVAW